MKVLDPGHAYALNTLDGDRSPSLLKFVKRAGPDYPGNHTVFPGTTTQEVLRALIDRTKYVNAQHYHIANLVCLGLFRNALLHLEMRAAERHGMELLEPTQNDVENVPVAENGHWKHLLEGSEVKKDFKFDLKTVKPDDSYEGVHEYAAPALPEPLQLLEEVKQCCLYAEDEGVGVTTEAHISEDLFERICTVLNQPKAALPEVAPVAKLVIPSLSDYEAGRKKAHEVLGEMPPMTQPMNFHERAAASRAADAEYARSKLPAAPPDAKTTVMNMRKADVGGWKPVQPIEPVAEPSTICADCDKPIKRTEWFHVSAADGDACNPSANKSIRPKVSLEPSKLEGRTEPTLTEQSEIDGVRNLYRLLRSDFNAVVDELVEKGYIDEFRE